MSGPVPKRNAERRRRAKTGQNDVIRVRTPSGRVRVPALPATTHLIARRWYQALSKSGQARFYEPSDWAEALLVCEAITLALARSAMAARASDYDNLPIQAAQLAVIFQGMDRLLTTEWARRHARMEIERETAQNEVLPGVAAILEFKQRYAAQES